jgi:hypothetical protein
MTESDSELAYLCVLVSASNCSVSSTKRPDRYLEDRNHYFVASHVSRVKAALRIHALYAAVFERSGSGPNELFYQNMTFCCSHVQTILLLEVACRCLG